MKLLSEVNLVIESPRPQPGKFRNPSNLLLLSAVQFKQTLIPGRLIRRYKRFLADIRLDDGALVTAHTPNTGAMTGCAAPGSRVWLSDSGNPKRKHPLSWELVETATGALVGVNTALANSLVEEAVTMGLIQSLRGYSAMRREAPYGKENSRIDLLLEEGREPPCYVEVKSVTLAEDGIGYFPDAVSERGSKHLRELGAVAAQGQRGVICFCAQREDLREVRPADDIDPRYGAALRQALAQGVEAVACQAQVSTAEIRVVRTLPVVCP